jgi:hypothetical protein
VTTTATNPDLRARVIVFVVLVAAVGRVSWPWLDPRFDWTSTFDGENHLIRLFLVGASIRAPAGAIDGGSTSGPTSAAPAVRPSI